MSVATAAFLAAWRKNTRQPVLLAKVEIAAPSAKTLYLGSDEIRVGTLTYQSAISSADMVRASSRMLSPGPDLATTSITLKAGQYHATLAATFADSLASYQWQGAIVTLWLWEKSLSDSADMLQQFKGRINRPVIEGPNLTLFLMQSDPLEAAIPDKTVNPVDYPNAPESGAGVPVPIIYGEHLTIDMRSPWADPYSSKDVQENLGGGLGAVPGLLTDPGYAGNDVRVTYASHAVMDLEDRTSGLTQFIVGGNQLNPLDTAATQETLTGDSYIEVDDDEFIAYCGIIPNDIVSATSSATPNTALNARNAMDIINETTYATLDQNLGYNNLVLRLPNAPALGRVIETHLYCLYSGDAANTHDLRIEGFQFDTSTSYANTTGTSTSATPAVISRTWRDGAGLDNLYDKNQWNFSGSGVTGVRAYFAAGTTNKAKIYFLGLRVQYRPQRNLVFPEIRSRTVQVGDFTIPITIDPWRVDISAGAPYVRFQPPLRPAIYDVGSAAFYGHIKGYADDGSGTYTGSAGTLIQRAPDIARHLLVTYAGVSGSGIETGTGATDFGSFVRARNHLNGGATGYNLACHIGRQTKVKRVLQAIATQSASTVYLDRFTSKWRWITWGTEEADAYDLTLDKESLLDYPRMDPVSDVDLRQRIAVGWYLDHFRNRAMFEAAVLPGRSSRGFNQPDYRDQSAFTVTAGVNDDLDWKYGVTTYADVLTAGTYTDAMALAEEVRTQMRTHSTELHVGWGFSVREDYNDTLDFSVGGTPYAATIPEDDYAGPEGLATAAQAALNAAGSGVTFTVAYDYSTFKYTVTGSGAFIPLTNTGTDVLKSGWFTLGIITEASNTTHAASLTIYAERFWVATDGAASNISLMFETGASAATSCVKLLGYSVDDYTAVNYHVGALRRNNRESAMSTAETTWGERESLSIAAEYVRQEAVAVLLRDRLADLLRNPPMRISFTTHRCPDLQRGRVISFAADVDDVTPYTAYGSNGSWAGKRFRVVEVNQHLVTAWHTEVVAVEVS